VSVLTQISAVAAMNLRTLRNRAGISSVVITGMAGAVGVLVAALAMASSLAHTFSATGHADRAFVLRSGSNYEISSTLTPAAIEKIRAAPGVRHAADGTPLVIAEFVTSLSAPKKGSGRRTSVSIRGSTEELTRVRGEIKVVEGRMFEPGLREVIVGRSAQSQFQGLALGEEVRSQAGTWTVVGVFESGGDAHESEIIADAATLLSAYRRVLYSSATVALDSPGALPKLKAALANDPTLNVEVLSEAEHYARQSRSMTGLLYFVSYVVGAIMALGAILAALSAMHAAINTRLHEIAVLRAVGFGAGSVVISVLLEALVLALIGAVLGVAVAWLLFSGATLSTLSGAAGNASSQVVYRISIGGPLIGLALLVACVVGMLGATLPALRAARLPVATALQGR
jgi:putative ABC transport system permease protein